MLKKETAVWINGIKFLACFCIFLDHFEGLLYHLLKASVEYSPVYTFINSCFTFLLNTYFYLSVFYIIGGVLAQNKPIHSFPMLIKTLVLRYLRFVVPMFFASMLVYLMSVVPGYYGSQVAELLDNPSWDVFKSETMTFLNVLKSTFLFDSTLNPILWTIRCIFEGTCIIYVLNYLTHSLTKKLQLVIYVAVDILLFILTKGTDVNLLAIACTVAGAILYMMWQLLPALAVPNKTATIISLFVYFILNTLYGKISDFLMRYITVGDGDRYYMILVVDFVIAFLFLFFIFYSKSIQTWISDFPLRQLYDSSFALYMVHEPLICSLSLYLLLLWYNPDYYYIIVPAIFIVTVQALFVAVLIYHNSVDKWCESILSRIKKLFDFKRAEAQ